MGPRARFLVTLQLLLGLSHVSMSELSRDDFFILVFPNGADLNHIKKKENRGKRVALALRSFDENPLIYTDPVAFGTYLQQKTKVVRFKKRRLKYFKKYPLEARNVEGLPIAARNITHNNQKVFLVPKGLGSHWHWYAFLRNRRLPLPDVDSSIGAMYPELDLSTKGPVELECLSSTPRVFKVHNFLLDHECDELIRLSEHSNALKQAIPLTGLENIESNFRNGLADVFGISRDVLDEDLGELLDASVADDVAVSDDSYKRPFDSLVENGTWPITAALKRRISHVTRIPYALNEMYGIYGSQGTKNIAFEGFEISRYNLSAASAAHSDYLRNMAGNSNRAYEIRRGGKNRYLTIILFLNTVKSGGQIVFPSSKNKTSTLGKTLPRGKKLRKRLKKLGIKKKSWEANLLNDCSRSLCIPPEKGSALLIYNFDYYKLRADAHSMYGECPVLKGSKWTAKMWLWNKQ